MSTPGNQVAASSVQGYVTSQPPRSPRQANFTDMLFQPGIATNAPSRSLKGRYTGSNRVRFHKGYPEKIGGWAQQPLVAPGGSPFTSQPRTKLLIHADGTNGSTSIFDSSGNGVPITVSGTVQISTAAPKFGTGCVSFAQNGALTVPVVPGGSMDFGVGDWTIECWLKPQTDGEEGFIFESSDGHMDVAWNDGSQQLAGQIFDVGIVGSSGLFPVGVWGYVTFVVHAGNLYQFANGVLLAVNPVTQVSMSGTFSFGGPSLPLQGFMDEIKVSSSALYTATFPVPGSAWPNPYTVPSTSYIGTVRATCDWASLDGQYWVAFATECKLYLVNNLTLYDITPTRYTSNTMNVFSTQNGQPIVTVTDPLNKANQGDHVYISPAVTIAGITIFGDYAIATVIDPNTYTIVASANATSTQGLVGGSVSLAYDISCGLAANGFLYGYGAGEYGEGTYGTPRAVGMGVPAKLRTWSLSNWGQDLVASYNNGELYWWQWTTGPNSRAALVANAPTDIQRILVNPDAEFLLALGCSDISDVADPMNVRWCSEADLTDWVPVILPVANTAGGQRLNFGSRMVTGIQSRQQNLLWSDTQLYQAQFLGLPNIFGFNELGKCYIVGPNAVIDVNGTAYMFCFDDIMIYDGTLRPLPCEMWETVFGPPDQQNPPTQGFDRSQAEMVYCASFMLKSEVTWYYPAYGTDVMQYITYNYDQGIFYGGTMPRTCYHDVTPALAGYIQYPYGFNGGFMYQHELGYDEQEGAVVNGMYWYLQSWDVGGQSDRPMLINSIIPEFARLRNGLQFSYLCKEFPQQSAYQQVGPFIITPDCEKVDERASGTQTALLLEAASVNGAIVLGQDFRLGVWQAQATPHGKRLGTASRGTAINTANP